MTNNFIKNIKKLIIYFFIIFTMNITYSFSQIINKINIIGNERLASQTIIMFSELDITGPRTFVKYSWFLETFAPSYARTTACSAKTENGRRPSFLWTRIKPGKTPGTPTEPIPI